VRLRDAAQHGPLTAEIIAVGAALLRGDRVDTNAAWLSGHLVALGIEVRRHTVVDDDVTDLATAVTRATDHHDVVIVTGGLGPAPDGVTATAVARAAGVDLERADGSAGVDLERGDRSARTTGAPRDRDLPTRDVVRPDLPAGARVVAPVGGAVGFTLEIDGALVVCLPAVPRELRAMVTAEVHALLLRRRRVAVRATGTRAVETAGIDGGHPEHQIARRLREHGWTLSVAESITGGGIGARLVTVPGASEWFAGGVIVYATAAKSLLAGVPPDLLDQQGPVSEDVAVALAVGVRRRLDTDVGLAVVGVAGPTTQGGRAVGTVCVGVALADGTRHAETTVVPARARAAVQQRSATVALDVLCRRLAGVTVGG
jgi:nicotinamide-nucleotide amidase